MDPDAPAKPPSSTPRLSNKKILVIVAVLIIVATSVFSLYKLNLLHFNFSGIQEPTAPQPQVDNQPHSEELIPARVLSSEIILPCPLKIQDCSTADLLTESKNVPNYKGLGYSNLPKGLEVIAIASGTYKITEAIQSPVGKKTISIEDNEQFIRVNYRMEGDIQLSGSSGTISRGEIIGYLSGEARGEFDKKYNLIISVINVSADKILKPIPLKDGIELNRDN